MDGCELLLLALRVARGLSVDAARAIERCRRPVTAVVVSMVVMEPRRSAAAVVPAGVPPPRGEGATSATRAGAAGSRAGARL
eukprot:1981534-Lingulodinium_polyedra.AAC.1